MTPPVVGPAADAPGDAGSAAGLARAGLVAAGVFRGHPAGVEPGPRAAVPFRDAPVLPPEPMGAPRTVLVVDDDVGFCEVLGAELAAGRAFAATLAHSIEGAEAARAAAPAFDAYILDVGLPDGDGRRFCAALRGQGIEVPILMLTGAGDAEDVVLGLEAGANDYVAKPFRMAVLMARLRSQCREFENSMHLAIRVGRYSFRPSEKTLRDTGKRRILLTDKECRILRRLCRCPGIGVPREVLLREVWGYGEHVTTHTLETHIYRLRQKIEADPGRPVMILCADGCYSLHPGAAA